MSTFPFAMIVSQSAMSRDFQGSGARPGTRNELEFEFLSALPNAPVVADRPARRPRTHRARSALAAALSRAATVIAPPPDSSRPADASCVATAG
jgi:hypothetical protein